MMPRRVVVAGYGMAGARLADEVRKHDPSGKRVALTVVGEEPHAAYNRILLSSVVDGSMPIDAIRMHDADWARHKNVDLRLGVSAVDIDRRARRILLSDSSIVDYDAAVLATGSRPRLPPVEGLMNDDGSPAPGVIVFRSVEDCQGILARARPGAPVAVLGGGLLGIEAARGLAGRGSMVTVVHAAGHLMERQLDAGAGRVLRKSLGTLGIEFRTGCLAAQYTPGEGLKLDDGTLVPADLIVVSAGVLPETTLAAAAGLTVDQGVRVDDALRTTDPRIFAIGDCARHPGAVPGQVASAWEQAAVLGALLTGADPAARYRGTSSVTRLRVRDVDVAALGESHVDTHADGAEVVRLEDPARGRYSKLVLRGDRVAGAIVLGAPDAAAGITQLFDHGTPAPADRLGLLLGRTGGSVDADDTEPSDQRLVCRCNSVTQGQLARARQNGARDVDALVAATRATTGCGTCRPAVLDLLDEWGNQ
jgi:assimilatory nitrate reductase electron transfer subunit